VWKGNWGDAVKMTEPVVTPSRVEEAAQAVMQAVRPWYENLRNAKGAVDSNVMCAGLYITEFLATAFPLTRDVYAADSQVRGASGAKAKALLADHGEIRRFTSEGGRTSRYTIRHAERLADIVNTVGDSYDVSGFSLLERKILAWILQEWFVDRVRDDYFGRRRIIVAIDPNQSVRATVAGILSAARERGGTTAGAVAQHLVGAKLKIRFPDVEVNVESYTTADVQTRRAGDYQIGDTAIHVTMSPSERLFSERCSHNLQHGFRPRVLVPEDAVAAATQFARLQGVERLVAVQSIEDFVGTNIEEVASFTTSGIRSELRDLLNLYNARITQAESDRSLEIEIPENL
jgi:hypothetical protein